MDTIACMRAFAGVAQEQSFTGAGRRLGMSTKQVSKYVGQLEERLEVQLFNRTTRNVSLTEVGAAYLDRCRSLLEQFDELEAAVREQHGALAGTVRVAAPTGFGSTRLVEALRPFMLAHPRVTIDLRLADHRVALVEEGFDLGIRIGVLRDSSLIARKLSTMPLICCASPEYLQRHGHPVHPRALATHSCLIDDNLRDSDNWHFRVDRQEVAVRVSGAFRANAPNAIATMAIAGLGVARCPLYQVDAALADGRLVRLFEGQEAVEFGLYAVYPPNRHLTARVRALIDHLAEAFRNDSMTER